MGVILNGRNQKAESTELSSRFDVNLIAARRFDH